MKINLYAKGNRLLRKESKKITAINMRLHLLQRGQK